jgi:actin-related protein 6
MDTPVCVLDNGASTIKAGIANSEVENTRFVSTTHLAIILDDASRTIVPNAVVRSKGDKKIYLGHEVEHCVDYSSLHYRLPFEKVRLISFGSIP